MGIQRRVTSGNASTQHRRLHKSDDAHPSEEVPESLGLLQAFGGLVVASAGALAVFAIGTAGVFGAAKFIVALSNFGKPDKVREPKEKS